MALISFQAGLYFTPKPSTSELFKRLRAAVGAVSDELKINLRPMDDVSRAALDGDLSQFEANAKQLFLLYDEERRFHETNEWFLHVSVVDDHRDCTLIHLAPELPEATRELTNLVWERLIELTRACALQLRPLFALINGLDEEVGGQIVSPSTVEAGSLPAFVTPYTYLDESIGDALPKAVESAGGRVQRLSTGWEIRFVDDFYEQPRPEILDALRRVYGTDVAPYEQTPVFED